MRRPLPLRRAAVPAVVIAAVLGVAIGAVTSGAGAAERPPGQPDPLPSPQLTIAHQQHAKKHSSGDATTVAWDKPLAFSMADGVLTSVHVSGDRGPVPGKLGADGTSWKATGGLIPRLDYTATIDYRDLSGVMQEKKVPVHAADSGRRVNVVLSPGDGDTVGIGMPVSVTFGLKVPSDLRSDVLRDLSVTTDPHVDGAWHWMSSQEVHWRPEQFWSPGTTVSVSSDLSKVYFGDGFWGDGKHQTSFHIGDAHISVAHVQSHKMVITSNGQQVKTVPISTGRAKYPTMNGVHVVLSKKPKVIMDSETVGIPRHSPDGYYEHVYWDTRISNSGEFVHAAPWSVKDQGKRNVSHGCINVTTSEAKWFYHFSQRGDVVKVVGSTRGPLSWDAGTEDWNMPWDTWTSG